MSQAKSSRPRRSRARGTPERVENQADLSPAEYRKYSVSRVDREPLVRFMLDALSQCGCRVLYCSPADEAPFRITFETREGERLGIVAYAFFANSRETKNRPVDEHRFQLKYGSFSKELHPIWQDPFGLYTTLFIGINPERGFFVGVDPVVHNPTRFFISLEFKESHVESILKEGWFAWERQKRTERLLDPVEVLVGGTPDAFLRYIRLEREALGEDQGHRQWLAEKRLDAPVGPHLLAQEFQLSEREVLDLIGRAGRLKMAVRGWVAEEHLLRYLRGIPGVVECERIERDSGPDVVLRLAKSRQITIECKNVLRSTARGNLAKLDFQRTRAAKADPCSRYYSPKDFDVVAACLHAQTDDWTFRFRLSRLLESHKSCPGKLASNVVIDSRWTTNPLEVLQTAIEE
jgi:hypothetical protein